MFLLCGLTSIAQSVLDLKLDGAEEGKSLVQFFEEFEQKHPVKFFYLPEWIANVKVNQSYKGKTLQYLLDDAVSGTDIQVQVVSGYAIVLVKDPSLVLLRDRLLETATKERKRIQSVVIGDPANGALSGNVTLQGLITDIKSKDPLVGATVIAQDIDKVVTTNPDGIFSIVLPIGQHILSVRYFNYEERVFDLQIYEDGSINILLDETPTLLEEIIVTDKAFSNISGNRGGQTTIKLAEIKKMPSFMGQVDLIRQVQTLPGVTSVGEVATGFNVRGGGVDQNLVLYDGIPVFNISHVFGFFSAFNSDALKEVSFYRGGIPAEYGGRVSSNKILMEPSS